MSGHKLLTKSSVLNTLAYLSFFLFSYWLMFATFSYNSKEGFMVLAPIVQSDFAANIPLIRSFSLGANWPPEYPLYPGLPIQYHFLFYFLVGMLEKIGFRIDWALNSLSILGFFGMMAMTYAIGKKLFNDARVGLLSVIFFIFNGTLSFWYYFTVKEKDLTFWQAFKQIFTGNEYASFGPWDPSPVLIFWNLNTYINQRHFCLALGALLALVYVSLTIHNQKRITQIILGVLFGLMFGFFPLLHKPVMLLAGIVMAVYFIAFPRMRLFLLFSGGIALLVTIALYLSAFKIGSGEKSIFWNIGFLVKNPSELSSYLSFFFYQFGFHCFLIPIGFVLAARQVKIIMIPAILALVVSFLVKFSIDVSANHKLINFTIIMLQMLSAFVIVYIYDNVGALCWNAASKIQKLFRRSVNSILAVLLLLLTFSGIMDIFVVINQTTGDRFDVKSSPSIRWIAENTPKDSVILNGTFIFDPASVAGRKIFLGYAYFIVSAGYDFGERVLIYREIYTSDDPYRIIQLLHENNIDYVEFQDEIRNGQNLEVKVANEEVFKKFFPLVFEDRKSYPGTSIYKVPTEKEWLAKLTPEQKKVAEQLRIKNQGDNFIRPAFAAGSNKLNGHAFINVDDKGDIYMMELSRSVILKYSPTGSLLTTIGTRGSGSGQTKDPNGIATDADGNIYIADTLNNRVQKFSPKGDVIKDWGTNIKLYAPNRIRVAPDNSIYVLDTGNHRVVQVSPEGEILTTFGSPGKKEGELLEPTDLVIVGDQIYVAETGTLRVSVFNLKDGAFIKSWPIPHWELRSWNKFRMAWDEKNQRLYMTNFISGNIFVHDKDGMYLGVITPKSKLPIDGLSDVFVSKDQEVFTYDIRNAQLLKIHDVTPVKR